jgi:hypothetical protein
VVSFVVARHQRHHENIELFLFFRFSERHLLHKRDATLQINDLANLYTVTATSNATNFSG